MRRADSGIGVAGEAVGVAAPVPALVMPAHDLLGLGQEFDRRVNVAFGQGDRLAAEQGCGVFMISHSSGVSFPGLSRM